MEYKYFSPYKVTYIFGFINSILLVAIYFIVSYIPCNCNYSLICDAKDNIYFSEYIKICNLLYKDNKYYFDNIYSAFNFVEPNNIMIKIIIIILIIFYSILLGAFSLLINIVINNYTVLHIFLFELKKVIFN